jgi:hypothetical protein
MGAPLIRRQRGVRLRQGNARVRHPEVLGQMLTPGGLNTANTLAGCDQVLQDGAFDRVQLAQATIDSVRLIGAGATGKKY